MTTRARRVELLGEEVTLPVLHVIIINFVDTVLYRLPAFVVAETLVAVAWMSAKLYLTIGAWWLFCEGLHLVLALFCRKGLRRIKTPDRKSVV